MRVVSFYSFKGGTGRTLLVANLAVLAARLGQRVVAVDLDLEAPGLPYKLMGSVPESGGVTGWLHDRLGEPDLDVPDLTEISVNRPFAPGGWLRLLPAGPPPSLDYLQQFRRLQQQGAFQEDAALDALLTLRDRIEDVHKPDLLLLDARTGITTTNAVTTRVLADDVVALTLDTPEQLEGTRAVLRSLAPLQRPGTDEPLGLHVVLSRVQGRPPVFSTYEWTPEERAKAARVAQYLREPAEPLSTTLIVDRVLLLHDEPRLYAGDTLLMARDDALDATALHVDYLRVARAVLGAAVDEGASAALASADPTQREGIARFFARVDDITKARPSNATAKAPDALVSFGLLQRLVNLRLQAKRDRTLLPDLAALLHEVSRRHAELGQLDDATRAARQAADLYRELATSAPERYRPELARSLNSLGIRLSEAGSPTEALPIAQEAVDIVRELAVAAPDRYRPDLAMYLTNLGGLLSEVGQPAAALPAGREAVDIFRQLSDVAPDQHREFLAGALNNLGSQLLSVGQSTAAIHAAREAIDIYRALAVTGPEIYLPDLALALNNLGGHEPEVGHAAEALSAAQEAVDIYRGLAAFAPDRYQPDLAGALNNLGIRLADAGQPAAALPAVQQALDIRRDLAAATPERYRADLGGSLGNLSTVMAQLGQVAEAMVSAQEAVDVYRQLTHQAPEGHRHDLATSLNNLGNRLDEGGQSAAAVSAAHEAVAIYRELTLAAPDRYLPDLAMSLANLGISLAAADQTDESLLRLQESVDIRRVLTEAMPDRFRPDLVRSLEHLGRVLTNLGETASAEAARSEARRLREQSLRG